MALNNPENILWHLVAGTKGGPNRLQILHMLSFRPYNANQLTKEISLDYKTVKHHLEILMQNGLVRITKQKSYGELYYLTDYAKEKMKVFEKIWKALDLGEG